MRRGGGVTLGLMPSFDVVSEIDMQEVRNAVDQAAREVANRFDFKGTNSSVDLGDTAITLHSVSEDRLTALRQVLEEKLVKRKVSLKALDYQKVEEASGGTARQQVNLVAGISPRQGHDHQQVHQGPGPQGCAEPGPGGAAAGDRARSATTCRPPSKPCARKTSASRCSSATSATDGGDPG